MYEIKKKKRKIPQLKTKKIYDEIITKYKKQRETLNDIDFCTWLFFENIRKYDTYDAVSRGIRIDIWTKYNANIYFIIYNRVDRVDFVIETDTMMGKLILKEDTKFIKNLSTLFYQYKTDPHFGEEYY